METDTFADLIRRVRAGDQAAASELVARYEPSICRAARLRLANSQLGRLFDSLDMCQSVPAASPHASLDLGPHTGWPLSCCAARPRPCGRPRR